MKKNTVVMATAAVSLLAGTHAMAYDGTVNFTGQLLDVACIVDIGASNTMTVDLGSVAVSSFNNVGDESSRTKFSLILKDCPASVNAAKVNFDGMAVTGYSELLALSADSGSATGVGIRLRTADQAPLGLNQTNGYTYPLSSATVNTLDFYAGYVAVSASPMAGAANAVANFTVNYN